MSAAARSAVGLGCGLLFGFGLALSGMLDPTRVRGFLDVFGSWDPSLAFVLAGAVVTSFVGVRLARSLRHPALAERYEWPRSAAIDTRLVAGAALFGVGWGLAGLCPGPAIADLAFNGWRVAAFVVAMLCGMAAFRLADTFVIRSRQPAAS